MPFTPKNWQDSPSTATPLSAAAIEDLETRVTSYADSIAGGPAGATTFFNAVDYGADPTGATDSRADIQSAIDAAYAAGGGVVFIPGGTYSIASTPGLKMKQYVKLQGAGMGATKLRADVNITASGVADGDAIIGTSTALSSYPTSLTTNVAATMTADVVPGAFSGINQILTMSSTAGLVANQWYLLGSDDRPIAGQTWRRGEYVRIQSVDSGTQVTLWNAVRDNYTVTNGAKLFTIAWTYGVGISDLWIDNPNFDASTTPFIWLTACRDFSVERVLETNCDTYGCQMTFCMEGRVDTKARNFNDNNAAGRNGYVTSVAGCCENITIKINVRRCRHGTTSGPLPSTPGSSRGILVHDSVVGESTSVCYDMHNGGADWVFSNCHAHNSSPGWGWQIRSMGVKLIGCTTDYCDVGLQLTGAGTLGFAENVDVIGCHFKRSLNRGGSAGFAVRSDTGAVKRVRFIGCTFDGAARQLVTLSSGDHRFLNCEFFNAGQVTGGSRPLDVGAGATVWVNGCSFATTATATDDPLSSAPTPGTEAIRLAASSTGSFIGSDNKQTGFTKLCSDLGTNTVQDLVSAYTVTGTPSDRALDTTTQTLADTTNVLGTLLNDLKTRGVIP